MTWRGRDEDFTRCDIRWGADEPDRRRYGCRTRLPQPRPGGLPRSAGARSIERCGGQRPLRRHVVRHRGASLRDSVRWACRRQQQSELSRTHRSRSGHVRSIREHRAGHGFSEWLARRSSSSPRTRSSMLGKSFNGSTFIFGIMMIDRGSATTGCGHPRSRSRCTTFITASRT